MSCFSCFSSHHKKSSSKRHSHRKGSASFHYREPSPVPSTTGNDNVAGKVSVEVTNKNDHPPQKEGNTNIAAQTFTFRELAVATKNFRQDCLVGEGGFGRVYKGQLEKTGQIVAVKQLDRNGLQGNREFLVEVLMLSLLHHQSLVNLIGYCADGDQRLLVYEFMSMGSLEDHLLDLPPRQVPLDWTKRMKIALDAARGLEYLHDKANPPVIYRDLKSSNILLDDDYNAKLSDFGLAKLGPVGDKTHVSSRVMGTYGYCAPEYQRTGKLTVMSDVYSFGVLLLELITGRRAIDNMRRIHEQTLVSWALPIIKEQNRHIELADPLLGHNFPIKSLNQAVAVAAMCIQEDGAIRPMMSDVVTALSYLGDMPNASENVEKTNLSFDDNGEFGNENEEEDEEEAEKMERKRAVEEAEKMERKRAVEEAIAWGSNSREQHMRLQEENV